MMRILMVLAAVSFGAGASAQEFPTKPVRVVVPFTAGGSASDTFARLVAQKLGEQWSQQVIIENRPGAGGSIGSALVAKAPPDGYTLLWNSSALVSNVALYRDLPYDPVKDFEAIAPAVRQPFALLVGASLGVKTLGEFLATARARPGQLTYASAGTGTATHFIAERFRLAAGLDALHVPYKGGTEAQADVIAQRVTYWFPPVVLAAAGVRDGRAAALAVTSARRSALLPDVPTMSEAGLAGVEHSIWFGLWAPRGTPGPLVERIAAHVSRALGALDLAEKLVKLGAEPMSMAPAEFARFARSEMQEALQLARAAGIKPE